MQTNTLYKHVNNTDVSFMPYVVNEQEDRLLVKGGWFNVVNKDRAFFISEDEITVLKKDLPNWKKLGE